jgi:hypothetical protein
LIAQIRRVGYALTWPFRQWNRLFEWEAQRRVDRVEVLITEGHEYERRLFWWLVVQFVLVLGVLFGYRHLPTPWWSLCGIVATWYAVHGTFNTWTRASAYRLGWTSGRQRMVEKLVETQKRGGSPSDWLDAEGNFDVVHVHGQKPLPNNRLEAAAWLAEGGASAPEPVLVVRVHEDGEGSITGHMQPEEIPVVLRQIADNVERGHT